MAYEHKENHGSMFPNDRKENPSQPDWRGKVNVEGKLFYISCWDENGRRNVAVKPVQERHGPGGPQSYQGRGSQNPPF